LQIKLAVDMLMQPDETTCGPTCLHAVYSYYGDTIKLDEVISEVYMLEQGGTEAVFLANHALRRGYSATIYTYNVQVFDPTWFSEKGVDLAAKLAAQQGFKLDPRFAIVARAYQEFLALGGQLRFVDLTGRLIRRHLSAEVPILTGLSATYLYRKIREHGPDNLEDDVRGLPVGHFVVLCGYDRRRREVLVADPLYPNPFAESHFYAVEIERLTAAILLGIVTYDANLLILEPRKPAEGSLKP
jgi:hypothetical protein